MRFTVIVAAMLLAGCGSAPAPVAPSNDAAVEPWYPQATARLEAMVRQTTSLIQSGRNDDAAAVITEGQPLMQKLLSVPRPTLAAMQAISDLDQLYGQMLITNHHYGDARLLFQMNATRWKNWQPQTADTERRLKEARDAMAECDRHIQ